MKSNSEPAGSRSRPLNAFAYLSRPEGELTPEEESALARELSAAYHMDESAATSPEVRHIAEKVRARMEGAHGGEGTP